jgi:hypothetical protein
MIGERPALRRDTDADGRPAQDDYLKRVIIQHTTDV